jgi:hypothetical protein
MRLHPPIVHPRRASALAAALALTVGLVACGASSSSGGVVSLADKSASPGQSAVPGASVDPNDAMQAFAGCMREHGVNLQIATIAGGSGGGVSGGAISGNLGEAPAPGDNQPPPAAPDPKAMQAADEACRHLLPQGGMGGPNATMDPALADQMLKFARCMRDHGVDMPDPQFSGGGVSVQVGGSGGTGALDPASQGFKAAQDACGKELPGGGPMVIGGSSSGASGGSGGSAPGTVVTP